MNRDLYEYLGVLGFDPQPFGNFTVAQPKASELPSSPSLEGAIPQAPALSGTGNPHARLMFVEEVSDDMPFAEKAQELLTKMIEAMGLKRDDLYITRALGAELRREIERVGPEVVVSMGAAPSQEILGTESFANARGQWHTYGSVAVMPTYAAAFLLRNPNLKKAAWEDLQQVMAKLGLKK